MSKISEINHFDNILLYYIVAFIFFQFYCLLLLVTTDFSSLSLIPLIHHRSSYYVLISFHFSPVYYIVFYPLFYSILFYPLSYSILHYSILAETAIVPLVRHCFKNPTGSEANALVAEIQVRMLCGMI